MPKISVIVPIYNAQAFLEKCIKSILAQSFMDFELILVNDGSADTSLQICQSFAQHDSRIKLIDKENGGVSSARNAGLKIAAGQYIAFVDSDDEVCENYLKLLLKKIEASDISIGTIRLIDEGLDVLLSVCDGQYSLTKFKHDAKNTFKSQCVNSPCNKLFKANIIKQSGLFFREDIKMGEDALFVISYLSKCRKITTFSDVIYIYHRGDNLNIRKQKKSNDEMLQNRIVMCGAFKEFFMGSGYTADVLVLREYLSVITADLKQNESIANKVEHFSNFVEQTQLMTLIDKIKVPFIKNILAYQWLTLLKKRKFKEYLEKYAGVTL